MNFLSSNKVILIIFASVPVAFMEETHFQKSCLHCWIDIQSKILSLNHDTIEPNTELIY